MTAVEVISLLVSLLALILAWRKSGSEIQASRGDAAESYANAAKTYAVEVTKLRTEIAELRAADQQRAAQLQELRRENDQLRDWAARLCYQVKSLGGIPVPLCKDEEMVHG